MGDLGALVNILVGIVEDMFYFLILLGLIMLGFANSFNLLFAESNLQKFDTFPNTLLTTYGMLLGDFDLVDSYAASDRALMCVLFSFYMFIVNIVLLNLLIAIMG